MNLGDVFGQHLRRAADGVQIHASVFRTAPERLRPHAALADHAPHTELFHDVRLIRLLANGSRRPRRGHFPFARVILHHHRAAMINDAALQIHPLGKFAAFVQIFMNRIAPGIHHTRNRHRIADLQRADLFLGNGGGEFDHFNKSTP